MSSGKKFQHTLRSIHGDIQIDDLWTNYFCVSCNLSTAETVVHRSGLLWEAVLASSAVPGVLPPVLKDGELLVDGAIVNNQPGDIMKKLCGGPVIVVNVSPEKELTVDASYREMPSPWAVLWSRVHPFKASIHIPTLSSLLMRTILVGSRKKARDVEKEADYYLRPPLNRFRMDQYARIEEIAEVGYQYAKAQIGEWKMIGRT